MLKTCSICGRIHDFNQVCTRPCKKKTTRQNEFRDSYQWKQKRNQIKSRDKYLCQVCLTDKYKTNYRYTYDELEVHHIVPIEEDYNLRLDSNNLITLCRMHHEMAEAGEISKEELKAMIGAEK
jgi:5-methylcytosine-specific restriction endonuclease McrA